MKQRNYNNLIQGLAQALINIDSAVSNNTVEYLMFKEENNEEKLLHLKSIQEGIRQIIEKAVDYGTKYGNDKTEREA